MSALDKAESGWPAPLPDWVRALAQEVDQTSQNRTAKRLDLSASTVSMVLGNTYNAGTTAVEERVRGVLMAETVTCPVLGETSLTDCRRWRDRARSEDLINTLRTTMRKACLGCPVYRRSGE